MLVTPGARVVVGLGVIGALVGFPAAFVVMTEVVVVVAVVEVLVEVLVVKAVVVEVVVFAVIVVTPGAKVPVPKRSHLQ